MIDFDKTEYELHQAEKARRRRRFETQTGAVHARSNRKNRRAEYRDNGSKRGKAAIREAISA